VTVHAERTFVPAGDVRGDRLAFTTAQWGITDQQRVGELRERHARVRPVGEEATNAGKLLGEGNVRHENAEV
jgi:hypothetical protein